MRLIHILRFAGLIALASSSSPALSQKASTSTLNCTTTDGFVSFHPTIASRVNESAYNKPKEEQQRSSRLLKDRRFDSYSGDGRINRRYDISRVNRRLESGSDDRDRRENERDVNSDFNRDEDKNVLGHASSRHLDNDRRFLTGASGDYFNRDQNRNVQRHSTSRYLDNDYISKLDDRLDYVNGNHDRGNFDGVPSHYLDEKRKQSVDTERDQLSDDQDKNKADNLFNRFAEHISKTNLEFEHENHNREKNEQDHQLDRLDDHTSKSNPDRDNLDTNQKNQWDHSFDRFNVDRISKINNQHNLTNIGPDKNEREYPLNHFNVDRVSKMDDDLDNNAQSSLSNRYLGNEKSKIYQDQSPTIDLDKNNSDKNLNVYPLYTNLNENSKDEVSEVIDKSLGVRPLEQHASKKYTIKNSEHNERSDVDHVETRETDEKLDDEHFRQRSNDQNLKRHFEDPHNDRHSSGDFNEDSYYPFSSDRDFKSQHFEKRVNQDKSSDYNGEVLRNKHRDEPNFDKYPLKELSDDLYPEKHTSDASASKLNPRDHHEELHSNQQAINEDFKIHNDPLRERRLGTNLYPDERFNDEHYERKIISHVTNRYRNSDIHSIPKVKDLNHEKYPDEKIIEDYTTIEPRKESNLSHLITFTVSRDWEENRPKLIFPNKTGLERYRMATLHLNKGLFIFDFLRYFLSFIQPKDVPIDILKDAIDGRIRVPTLIGQTIYLEVVFIAVIVIMTVLMLIVPSTEFWLCCRPNRYNYRRKRRRSMTFFLALYTLIIIGCAVTMLICNEEVNVGINTIPKTVEAVIQDLRDYHAGTAGQLRKCLTQTLDVASEAILADLDNVEELLGKPVQAQLSQETGVDIALEELMDVANSSQELAYKTDGLLKRADRAREFAAELGRETDDIRRDLERAQRDCGHEDRSLCAVLDPTGLHLALRLDRVARDDRLLRLRTASRDNLTELGRQARGEYLYVPHHVGRNSLETRNLIRREVNTARAKVSDEARSIEASGSDMTNQLDSVRELSDKVIPYINKFEQKRWLFGFSTSMCVLFIWLLLFGAVCCHCGCSEGRVRPTLLWFVFFSTFLSIGLWLVVMVTLAIASHTEMLLCRPLDDPEFRTVEAILETKNFLGKRLSVPLKDLFEKCEENDAAYPAYQLDNSVRLEQLTSHWTWNGLTRAFSRLRVDLTGLRVLSPNLRERLQNLLYASGPNLTEHRIMIQGPILNKDLNALSDQVENVARQLTDRRTARSFQTIAAQMRDLLSRRVKPLMKMQDELVYHLATLELHLQPLQQKVNHTMSQLRSVQYFIDNQGDKIAQLKTKAFVDRLSSYLDEWRAHVLTEMSARVSKCRPLWDILQGIKLLICSHILGPLNGYWFATFICAMTLLICTPSAHSVASGYHRATSKKGSVLLPSRQGSPDTVVMERETWRTPPPPSVDSW